MKKTKHSFLFFFIAIGFFFTNTKIIWAQASVDSIFHYYQLSKNKNLSYTKRLQAINKAYTNALFRTNDTLASKILYQKSILHLSLKQQDSFLFANKLLFEHVKKTKNTFYLGKHYYLKAHHHRNTTKQYDSAFYYYNQAKTQFATTNDSSQIGRQLLSMALIQQTQNDYIGSKETITNALHFLLPKKDIKYFASSYSVLADNHRKLLNYKDAITYYKKAIAITKSIKNRIGYQNNLATVYIDSKEYKNALQILKTLAQDSMLEKESNQYARIIDNLGYAQWLENNSQKPELMLTALDIRLKNNDKRGLIASYIHLGEYFLKLDIQKSLSYFNKAIEVSKLIKSPKGELEALQFLMQLKPKYIAYKDRYIVLNDSLYKQELKAKTQFAKMKYDDETKQKTIIKLELEKTEQILEVTKQQTQKIVYLTSGIILLIAGGFIFYIAKQRHKKDKLQEIYSTETRISKKVHDELANDVYNVMNKIQNKANAPQKDIINQLDSIYQRTRDISYENGVVDLNNDYYFQELKEMISAYQDENTKILIHGLRKEIWDGVKDSKKIVVERVLKELMTNMKKHSKAINVMVSFKKDKQKIIITYTDNGVGIKKTDRFKNSGLQNAENRMKNINGSFIFDLNREKGLGITVSFPV